MICCAKSLNSWIGKACQLPLQLSTPESKTVVQVSLGWACAKELFGYGAVNVLKREYGDYLLDTPEQGFDVTLSIDLEKVPAEKGSGEH